MYTVKIGLDGWVDHLKALLVAKGYTQVYGSDYYDTFFPLAKIAYVRLLLSMVAMQSWPLYQLDIKKCLLTWRPGRGCLYGATIWVCCSGGVWIGMQAMPLIIWLEVVPLSLVWAVTPIFKHISFKPFQICGSILFHYGRPINI